MDSSLVRVIVATFCGYLFILFIIYAYDRVFEEYPRRPAELINYRRIQHPYHHQKAVEALRLFSQLPKSDKIAFMADLQSNIISLKQWMTILKQSKFQILCMGELHEESTRSFLSKEFFANFSVDVLLLETTPEELKDLINRREAGRDYFPLLDADIMNILRSARNKNSKISIHGIEETGKQSKIRIGHSNSRDQWIARNFWAAFQPGLRHVILFGALHCMNDSGWLFNNLCNQASPSLREKMLNVKVLEEHQNGPLEAFVYFINELGVKPRVFVVSDTRAFPNHVYNWFPLLNHQMLEKYESLIVFSHI